MHSGITVYFRKTDFFDDTELNACREVFDNGIDGDVVEERTRIIADQIVIPRYTMLPFGRELCNDIYNLGSTPINKWSQHCYVAELRNWFLDFADITPNTWFSLDTINEPGPYVLKGSTNSKKFSWNTHMYAKDRAAAGEVYMRLLEDGLIGTQDIVIRKYVPLKNYGVMPCGIPISHEFRCFFYRDVLLTKAFYWSNEDVEPVDDVPASFLADVANRASPHINFWVADVAQTEAGDWIVVELNDGCMSGLSRNDPKVLYSRLKEEINR